ncbi:MAG: hypothetical protein AVDCRST_MAG32-836, partial [uncultured Nocardioides sp.]
VTPEVCGPGVPSGHGEPDLSPVRRRDGAADAPRCRCQPVPGGPWRVPGPCRPRRTRRGGERLAPQRRPAHRATAPHHARHDGAAVGRQAGARLGGEPVQYL